MARQCWHCETGRPFLLMCCSGRSEIGRGAVSSSSLLKVAGSEFASVENKLPKVRSRGGRGGIANPFVRG